MSNNNYPVPIFRMRSDNTRYTYHRVILRKDGMLWLGNITTHLSSLEDWAEMKGYKLITFENRTLAQPQDRTNLVVRRGSNGSVSHHTPTVMGMPAVQAPSSGKIIPSNRPTMLGLPVAPIAPVKIKVIE